MGTMRTIMEEKEESQVPELADALQSLHDEMKSLRAELRDSLSHPEGTDELVKNIKFVIDMMMEDRGERYNTPRLCCVLPPWNFGREEGISFTDQSPTVWMSRLNGWQEDNFKGGKTVFTKRTRLFLVCAHTYRLVSCGAKGQGYEIREVRERWKKVGSFLLTALQLSCATVGAGAAAGVPSTVLGEAAKATLGLAEEAARSELGRLKEHVTADEQGIMSKRTRDTSSPPVSKVGLPCVRFPSSL